MRRHEISDADWERVRARLPSRPGPYADDRLFVNAVLYVARTDLPWRDLPDRFGPWGTVWKRFDRWARRGVWAAVFEALQDPDVEWLLLDSTVIRAHPCAAGAKKKRTAPAGRRSRTSAGAAGASAPRSTRR